MECPFLRESRVNFCRAVPFKKVIEQTSEGTADLCMSSAFHGCAAFREHRGRPCSPPCPFLQESRAQVCSQDPTVRLIPCSDQVLSRCVTGNHRYCEIYLAAGHRTAAAPKPRGILPTEMPATFFLTHNHMWLDFSTDHDCHIGLDALMTRVLGQVDKLSFVTSQGEQCPSVVITAHGVNLHMVFPKPMQITCPNAQVRVNPERILLDPYGAGWLFEGSQPKAKDIRCGLLSGDEARCWMDREVQRVSELIQRLLPTQEGRRPLAADGGLLVEGAIRLLKRNDISTLFDELFTIKEVM